MSADDTSPWSPEHAGTALPASDLPASDLPAPPTTLVPPPPQQVLLARTPRPGELTPAWRLVTVVLWVAVAVALGSVWRTSDQLGLSTWWLGPRGDPQPRVMQVLPFLPALLMILGAINNVRRLPLWGLVAAALVVAMGVVDLDHVVGLGLIEIGIGIAAAAVSIASFTGSFRPAPGRPHD